MYEKLGLLIAFSVYIVLLGIIIYNIFRILKDHRKYIKERDQERKLIANLTSEGKYKEVVEYILTKKQTN